MSSDGREPTVNSMLREEVLHLAKQVRDNSKEISALIQSKKDQGRDLQRLEAAIERNRETCANCPARGGWIPLQNDVVTLENKMDDVMLRKGWHSKTSYYPTTKKSRKSTFFKTSSEKMRIVIYVILGAAAITGCVVELLRQGVIQ